MSDLDRAREALLTAAIRRFNADQRWERARLKDAADQVRFSDAYFKAFDAFDAAGDAYARAAREEGEHGK